MSHYQEVSARAEKMFTYYVNAKVVMAVIVCAQETIKSFEVGKESSEKAIPGLKKQLDEAQNTYAAWLEEQLACPLKRAQLFADMQEAKEHPGNLGEIVQLEELIEYHIERLKETPEILAAKKLVKQFEKFGENPQLELEFEELQEEYQSLCSCGTCNKVDDGYDYF